MNRVSNCCSAPLLPIETDICSYCYEHCDPINIGEDDNGNIVRVKI